MSLISRRRFLGSSVAGAAALALAPALHGQEKISAARNNAPAEPDSLFLTWQQDPTTTMTVQWIGPETAADTSLQYAPLTAQAWQTARTVTKPYTNTDLKVHRCELTRLMPGTEYKFRLGGSTTDLRFRTMPAKATSTIQWVSGGDAGVGEHAIGTNIVAARQEPYFALIGGDLAYDNGTAPQTFLKFLQNYRQHMVDPKGRLIPMLSCPGNHEVNGGYKGTRDKSPSYLSVFDGLFRDQTYDVLDFGDYLSLVLLDTGHLAPIAGEQTSWLAKTLAQRQDRPHLIVANHVPAYPSYRAPDNKVGEGGTGYEQRQLWAPLFEKFNVDVVLEHHDHTFKRTHPLKGGHIDKYGVLYLGDGSWGKLRVPKTPEERPYLAAVSEAYHMTVHRLEGEQRFHVALEESGKIADVCMTVSKRPAKRG
jgi:purple acid phosphatase-like protein/calcineurin-like phosphoesterase family protein